MPTTTTNTPHAGRVALVTGAARGIGQAIAVGLAKRGANLVIGDIGDLAETSALISEVGKPALSRTAGYQRPKNASSSKPRAGRLRVNSGEWTS